MEPLPLDTELAISEDEDYARLVASLAGVADFDFPEDDDLDDYDPPSAEHSDDDGERLLPGRISAKEVQALLEERTRKKEADAGPAPLDLGTKVAARDPFFLIHQYLSLAPREGATPAVTLPMALRSSLRLQLGKYVQVLVQSMLMAGSGGDQDAKTATAAPAKGGKAAPATPEGSYVWLRGQLQDLQVRMEEAQEIGLWRQAQRADAQEPAVLTRAGLAKLSVTAFDLPLLRRADELLQHLDAHKEGIPSTDLPRVGAEAWSLLMKCNGGFSQSLNPADVARTAPPPGGSADPPPLGSGDPPPLGSGDPPPLGSVDPPLGPRPWTPAEDRCLVCGVQEAWEGSEDTVSWPAIVATFLPDRTVFACRKRFAFLTSVAAPPNELQNLVRKLKQGKRVRHRDWRLDEDIALASAVGVRGTSWRAVAEHHLPRRTRDDCKHRWNRYVKPLVLQAGADEPSVGAAGGGNLAYGALLRCAYERTAGDRHRPEMKVAPARAGRKRARAWSAAQRPRELVLAPAAPQVKANPTAGVGAGVGADLGVGAGVGAGVGVGGEGEGDSASPVDDEVSADAEDGGGGFDENETNASDDGSQGLHDQDDALPPVSPPRTRPLEETRTRARPNLGTPSPRSRAGRSPDLRRRGPGKHGTPSPGSARKSPRRPRARRDEDSDSEDEAYEYEVMSSEDDDDEADAGESEDDASGDAPFKRARAGSPGRSLAQDDASKSSEASAGRHASTGIFAGIRDYIITSATEDSSNAHARDPSGHG